MHQPPPAWMIGLFGALLLAGGLAALRRAFQRLDLRRKVADTPTSRAASAPLGPVELRGMVREWTAPLMGPFSGAACGWWRASVEEERVQNSGRGARREWVVIYRAVSNGYFDLEDSSGRLTVDPAGAEVDAPLLFDYINGWSVFGASLGAGPSGPEAAAWLGTGLPRRRLREWRLDVGMPLCALGVLRSGTDKDGRPGGKLLRRGEEGEPYLLSHASQAELLNALAWSVLGWMGLGLLGLGLGAWFLQGALH